MREPMYKADVVSLLDVKIINDTHEFECKHCAEWKGEVECYTEPSVEYADMFGGRGHYQVPVHGNWYQTEFICPKCGQQNDYEDFVAED